MNNNNLGIYIIVIGIIVIGLLVWQRADPPGEVGIPPEVLLQLDTLHKERAALMVDKAVLQVWNGNLTNENIDLRESLTQIKPNSTKKWNEYKEKPRSEKETIALQNIERMKKEMGAER